MNAVRKLNYRAIGRRAALALGATLAVVPAFADGTPVDYSAFATSAQTEVQRLLTTAGPIVILIMLAVVGFMWVQRRVKQAAKSS